MIEIQSHSQKNHLQQTLQEPELVLPNGNSMVKFTVPDEEDYPKQLPSNPQETLQKFISFIKFHAIEPLDIWDDSKGISVMLFSELAQRKLGYELSVSQMRCLVTLAQQGILRKDHFKSLGLWKDKKYSITTAISQKSLFEIKKRGSSTTKLESKTLHRASENSSKPTILKTLQNLRLKSTCEKLTKTFLKTGFVGSQSTDVKLQALRQDLEMNALQKKWQFVIMAGQMNKWIEEALSDTQRDNGFVPIKFKVINRQESCIVLMVDGSIEEVIPEVVFIKKYNAMKKKQHSRQSQVKNVQHKSPKIQLQSGKSKLSQRDQQLNQSLLHIMRVKDILLSQNRVLTQTAINC